MYRGVGIALFVLMSACAVFTAYTGVFAGRRAAERVGHFVATALEVTVLWFIGASLGWW